LPFHAAIKRNFKISNIPTDPKTGKVYWASIGDLADKRRAHTQHCNYESEWNGQGFLPQKVEVETYTDVSEEAWGIVIKGKAMSRTWSAKEQPHYINWKELLVFWLLVHLSGNVVGTD
jgi:hypothetical protein